MHVYHFGPYEPGALKRLMGRYATRENEIDRMLRAGVLIDLHSITRQSVRASVEQYSLKRLEPFHDYMRIVPLEQARRAIHQVEHTLELSREHEIDDITRQAIEGYNRDDCASTRSLRDWLETQRRAIIAAGQEVPRPPVGDGAPSEALDEQQTRIATLVGALIADVPADEALRTPAQAGRWLLANILDYHRREGKANWWEYFRLRDLPDDDLYDEKSAIAGLIHTARQFEGRSRLPTDTYSYPDQETDVRGDDELHHGGQKIGTVTATDPVPTPLEHQEDRQYSRDAPAKRLCPHCCPSNRTCRFTLSAWIVGPATRDRCRRRTQGRKRPPASTSATAQHDNPPIRFPRGYHQHSEAVLDGNRSWRATYSRPPRLRQNLHRCPNHRQFCPPGQEGRRYRRQPCCHQKSPR